MNISNLKNSDNYEDKILLIMNQTIYNYEDALLKLKEFDFNHIDVIKNYMGILEKKESSKINSINQEIYKQIRKKMDISEYNKKHPLNIDHIRENFNNEH